MLGGSTRGHLYCPADTTQDPCAFLRIELLDDPRRVSGKDAKWWRASRYYRVGSDNAVLAEHQFTIGADDGGALSDPASFADLYSAARDDSLESNWHGHIVEGMTVVLNKNRRRYDCIISDEDEILCRYVRATADQYPVAKLQGGILGIAVRRPRMQPNIFMDNYVITDLH
jgi:hypothetical protein